MRWIAALALLALGCDAGAASISDGPVSVDVTMDPPALLSDTRILEWDGAELHYNERVVPYDLNTPLFSDFALKARAIYVPEGETIAYDPTGPFDLPVGTVIVKTFYFPADFRRPDEDLRLIETRLLIHTPDGWEAWPYVWNEAQTDAELHLSGETRAISFVGADGESETASYLIPQRNQCRSCHERNVGEGGSAALTPIGPAARHLNRDYDYGSGPVNQLAHLAELGMLEGLPAMTDVPAAFDFHPVEAEGMSALADADVERAARDYLDINCAHCHDPRGTAGVTSQLFLNHDNTDEFRFGVCKRPGSAGAGTGGFTWDVVPGDPDTSILLFRLETTEVGAMMPLLGRSLRHTHGTEVVRRWIAAMPPIDCTTRE